MLKKWLENTEDDDCPADVRERLKSLYEKGFNGLQGFCQDNFLVLLAATAAFQEKHRIAGSLYEVGLFQRKSFLALEAGEGREST